MPHIKENNFLVTFILNRHKHCYHYCAFLVNSQYSDAYLSILVWIIHLNSRGTSVGLPPMVCAFVCLFVLNNLSSQKPTDFSL